MASPRTLSCLVAAAVALAPLQARADSSDARLHLEQQQQALDLSLQQSRARRLDVSPADARKLDRLHVQQRLEQQQLELQQLARDRALQQQARVHPSDAIDRERDAQRRAFAQERELQNQRFELDRHRLLQSMPRQPLQRPYGAPAAFP